MVRPDARLIVEDQRLAPTRTRERESRI